MRTRLALIGSAAALAFSLGAVSVASAQTQSPFTIRTGGGTAAESGVATRASPTQQRREAAAAAAGLGPNAATQANAPTNNFQGRGGPVAAAGPAPFDVNNDGIAVPFQLPVDEETFNRPSTTTSPLSTGTGPANVLGIDAVSEEQVRALNGLLRRDSDQVRELRVNVENDQEFVDSIVDRPIVPFRTLRLDGEIASETFRVFLSAAEAARGGTLSIAFTNSVLVLPEASRLRVFVNGRQIAQTAIDSPDRTKVIALPVDAALMWPGANAIRLETEMRHRIDCSLDATYELWTRIDTRLTGLTFGGGRIPLTGLNDLPAVGVGTNGATRMRVVMRDGASPTNIDRMLRAVQAAALRGRFVQPLVEVVPNTAGAERTPGVVNIIIGTYEDVRGLSRAVPNEGAVGPVATLIDTPDIGPTVIITGPNERAVDTALARFDTITASDDRLQPLSATPPWLVPDAVRVSDGRSFTLADAGVQTINFSGRRFSTKFQVTLPPDFFAAAYGEATLFLDAAYDSVVEPGSRLSVFVNGVLSTAISFTSSDGEVLQDFPIVLVMEQFRPGINNVQIVADLETRQDRECLPGGTVPARDRFALFSTTRLQFPDFARIGQIPHLASFATNGFPYQLGAEPVRVRVGGRSADTVGAAGTLIARVAISRGAPLATNVVEDAAAFPNQGLIVVAPLQEVSNLTLETTGANSLIPSTWLSPAALSPGGAEPQGLERYEDVLRRLRQQLRQEEVQLDRTAASDGSLPDLAPNDFTVDPRTETQRSQQRWFEEVNDGGGVGEFLRNVMRSIRDAFNLDFNLGRSNEQLAFDGPLVSEASTLIMAQAPAPTNGSTAWTLVTAPSPGLLSTSVAALSAPEVWTRIGGRVTAYELENNSVDTIQPTSVDYLATLPLSFTNLRLIAANWFSINNGVYAIALIVMATLLGIVTYLLILPLGRENENR